MLQKIGESIRLFKENLALFSLITLTIWLPGSLVMQYLRFFVFSGENDAASLIREIRIENLIEGTFGPVYIGALIYALFRLKQRQPVTYSEAIAVGFRKWFKIFFARLVAGLLILGGLVFFVVPGIVLLVCYSLIDPIVVIEGANAQESRKRSSALTRGRRWQIFGASILISVGVILLSLIIGFVIYLPVGLIGQEDNFFASLILDCILSVLSSIFTVLMFLFYWEARSQEQVTNQQNS